MGLIFSKVLEMSMAAVLLILAVALLRIPLKKAPKWFMGVLWTIVAIRLLVPVQIEAGFGLMPDFGRVLSSVMGKEPAKASTYQTSEDSLTYVYESEGEGLSAEQTGSQRDDGSTGQGTIGYLSALWIVGIILAIGYASYSYISIWRKTRVSIRYRSSDKVYVCDEIDTPFIFGLIKPVIYLPSGLDHDTIVNVIAHEKAHLKRKDHLRKGLGFFILSIHWFNPFVWLAYVLFCRDIELACDERVISTMSTDEKKSYAESLLSCSTKKRRMMVYPVAFCEVAVGTRIRQIFNYRRPTFYLVLLLVVITGTLATCSFTRAADKIEVVATTHTVKVKAPVEIKTPVEVEVGSEKLYVRTRIEDIIVDEGTDSVQVEVIPETKTEVKVNAETQNSAPIDNTSEKPSEAKKEDAPKAVSVDVKDGNTHVRVSTDDVNSLTSMAPVQEVVNVTEDIVDGVTDEFLIEGGIADTAVDTAFSITTDTLGIVDSILGW